jgi:hypothetical protein
LIPGLINVASALETNEEPCQKKTKKDPDRGAKQWLKKLDTDLYEQRVEFIP